ncbi:glycosyltransferase [Balneolaceae bacterium ANBcel3]|nr:glycosyltransferase [Balneolaceae bacterium ANBcel3]
MNIIFVQSYPVYHDLTEEKDFPDLANRDKWMPALCIQKGYPSSLWAAGNVPLETEWQYDDLPSLPVRIFEADKNSSKSREHTSRELCEAAKKEAASFFVIKGADGGVGLQLIREVLIPNNIPFAVILDGIWYHPFLKHAFAILYETEGQKKQLSTRGLRFWRPVIDEEKLIHLEKSVDTRHFSPDSGIKKEFDVIAMGRLLPNNKNYDALFRLSHHLKIGVIGGGPMYETFKNNYPKITWFGTIPHHEVPDYLNKGRLFFHTGLGDHFPCVIAEASSCGIPPVAFKKVIHEDVIPEEIGLRVSKKGFATEIQALLSDEIRLKALSKNARKYAQERWNHTSSSRALRDMMLLFRALKKTS